MNCCIDKWSPGDEIDKFILKHNNALVLEICVKKY